MANGSSDNSTGYMDNSDGSWSKHDTVERPDGSYTTHIYWGPDKNDRNLHGHDVMGVNQKGEMFGNRKHDVQKKSGWFG